MAQEELQHRWEIPVKKTKAASLDGMYRAEMRPRRVNNTGVLSQALQTEQNVRMKWPFLSQPSANTRLALVTGVGHKAPKHHKPANPGAWGHWRVVFRGVLFMRMLPMLRGRSEYVHLAGFVNTPMLCARIAHGAKLG